jgi:hypothetical protein
MAMHDLDFVQVSALKVDPGYQRALGPIHVDNIVDNFRPDSVGIITVSERKDGLYLIDGHHRWVVCKRLGIKEMEAEVYRGMSRQEEAAMFLDRNFKKSVLPAAKFKSRVLVQEPQVLAIIDAVEAAGFKLDPSHGGKPNRVTGISKLDHIYERFGAPTITQILHVIRLAWPEDSTSRQAAMLGGMVWFLSLYPSVSGNALARKLESADPKTVLQARRTYMRELGIEGDTACARAIWFHWNKGRRNKLPNLFDK